MVSLGAVGLGAGLPPWATAMHEIDHRFTVEGYVCGQDGRPVSDLQVVVKDTRVSVGTSVYTDARGYYKATLHLHNDNQGDPILISIRDQEKKIAAKFDPNDVRTERRAIVNFGSGCEQTDEGTVNWVYYGLGLGLAGSAALAGAKWARRLRLGKRGKRQRKKSLRIV